MIGGARKDDSTSHKIGSVIAFDLAEVVEMRSYYGFFTGAIAFVLLQQAIAPMSITGKAMAFDLAEVVEM